MLFPYNNIVFAVEINAGLRRMAAGRATETEDPVD